MCSSRWAAAEATESIGAIANRRSFSSLGCGRSSLSEQHPIAIANLFRSLVSLETIGEAAACRLPTWSVVLRRSRFRYFGESEPLGLRLPPPRSTAWSTAFPSARIKLSRIVGVLIKTRAYKPVDRGAAAKPCERPCGSDYFAWGCFADLTARLKWRSPGLETRGCAVS
jgi:hypothetical protein